MSTPNFAWLPAWFILVVQCCAMPVMHQDNRTLSLYSVISDSNISGKHTSIPPSMIIMSGDHSQIIINGNVFQQIFHFDNSTNGDWQKLLKFNQAFPVALVTNNTNPSNIFKLETTQTPPDSTKTKFMKTTSVHRSNVLNLTKSSSMVTSSSVSTSLKPKFIQTTSTVNLFWPKPSTEPTIMQTQKLNKFDIQSTTKLKRNDIEFSTAAWTKESPTMSNSTSFTTTYETESLPISVTHASPKTSTTDGSSDTFEMSASSNYVVTRESSTVTYTKKSPLWNEDNNKEIFETRLSQKPTWRPSSTTTSKTFLWPTPIKLTTNGLESTLSTFRQTDQQTTESTIEPYTKHSSPKSRLSSPKPNTSMTTLVEETDVSKWNDEIHFTEASWTTDSPILNTVTGPNNQSWSFPMESTPLASTIMVVGSSLDKFVSGAWTTQSESSTVAPSTDRVLRASSSTRFPTHSSTIPGTNQTTQSITQNGAILTEGSTLNSESVLFPISEASVFTTTSPPLTGSFSTESALTLATNNESTYWSSIHATTSSSIQPTLSVTTDMHWNELPSLSSSVHVSTTTWSPVPNHTGRLSSTLNPDGHQHSSSWNASKLTASGGTDKSSTTRYLQPKRKPFTSKSSLKSSSKYPSPMSIWNRRYSTTSSPSPVTHQRIRYGLRRPSVAAGANLHGWTEYMTSKTMPSTTRRLSLIHPNDFFELRRRFFENKRKLIAALMGAFTSNHERTTSTVRPYSTYPLANWILSG